MANQWWKTRQAVDAQRSNREMNQCEATVSGTIDLLFGPMTRSKGDFAQRIMSPTWKQREAKSTGLHNQ